MRENLRWLGCVSALILAASAAAAQNDAARHDLVIRNGRVLDGAGNPWVLADVAVDGDRIVRVGKVEGRGEREIDAAGRYVSPGWIDVMDQSGRTLLKNGLAENKLHQGVTTVIAGEGGTPVPADEIDGYFQTLEKQGISVNFGTYYSATQARMEVMGGGAGTPTDEQIAQMQAKVRTAMDAGTFGVATALIYPPGSFQTTEELTRIVSASAACDGIYATHMRDESADLLGAIREAIEIGEKAGVKVEIFHLKAAYAPQWGELMPQAIALIDQARARGVDVAADVYPYEAGGTGLSITVPNWVYADGGEEAMRRLRDPQVRERLKRELAAGSQPGWSNLVEASGGWDRVVLANAYNEKYDAYRFKSIADIAKALDRDPADVAWDIVVEAVPHRAMALFFMMDERDIETALRAPWTSIGSDAGAAEKFGEMDGLGLPHPRAYGTFPRIIAEYVKRRPVLSLEDAVRKMTSWPAQRMGLRDRGVIREGLVADLTIFDYERIDDVADWESPMGVPEGIDYVVVSGRVVLDQGKHNGEKPGKVLKGACGVRTGSNEIAPHR